MSEEQAEEQQRLQEDDDRVAGKTNPNSSSGILEQISTWFGGPPHKEIDVGDAVHHVRPDIDEVMIDNGKGGARGLDYRRASPNTSEIIPRRSIGATSSLTSKLTAPAGAPCKEDSASMQEHGGGVILGALILSGVLVISLLSVAMLEISHSSHTTSSSAEQLDGTLDPSSSRDGTPVVTDGPQTFNRYLPPCSNNNRDTRPEEAYVFSFAPLPGSESEDAAFVPLLTAAYAIRKADPCRDIIAMRPTTDVSGIKRNATWATASLARKMHALKVEAVDVPKVKIGDECHTAFSESLWFQMSCNDATNKRQGEAMLRGTFDKIHAWSLTGYRALLLLDVDTLLLQPAGAAELFAIINPKHNQQENRAGLSLSDEQDEGQHSQEVGRRAGARNEGAMIAFSPFISMKPCSELRENAMNGGHPLPDESSSCGEEGPIMSAKMVDFNAGILAIRPGNPELVRAYMQILATKDKDIAMACARGEQGMLNTIVHEMYFAAGDQAATDPSLIAGEEQLHAPQAKNSHTGAVCFEASAFNCRPSKSKVSCENAKIMHFQGVEKPWVFVNADEVACPSCGGANMPETGKPRSDFEVWSHMRREMERNLMTEEQARQPTRGSASSGKASPAIVLMVHSGRQGAEKRQIVRETWMQTAQMQPNLAAHFAVGARGCDGVPERLRLTPDGCEVDQDVVASAPATTAELERTRISEEKLNATLRTEALTHGDLVLLPVRDSYGIDLAQKNKAAFSWVVETYPDFTWILHADDDVYVKVQPFEAFLLSLVPHGKNPIGEQVVVGEIKKEGSSHVLRNMAARNWEPTYDKPWYPDYPRGGAAYAVTKGVASFVRDHRQTLPSYNSEDASLGIWIAEYMIPAGIPVKLVDTSGHSNFLDLDSSQSSTFEDCCATTDEQTAMDCRNPRTWVIGHQLTPKQMRNCHELTTKERHQASEPQPVAERQQGVLTTSSSPRTSQSSKIEHSTAAPPERASGLPSYRLPVKKNIKNGNAISGSENQKPQHEGELPTGTSSTTNIGSGKTRRPSPLLSERAGEGEAGSDLPSFLQPVI